MMRGLFITGTDTGVGKTIVAAALMHRYRDELKLRYWKPIQTGIEQDDDTAVVRTLGACSVDEIVNEGVRLKRAVSPHLAARLSSKRVTVEQIHETVIRHTDQKAGWLVEGAGGPLAPINESEHMVDLMWTLNLPVLVCASTRLGTINHTLLTLEALRRRALIVAGVVMVGEKDPHNREAVEHYGAVHTLGEMPLFPELKTARIKQWAEDELDQQGVLRDHLQLAHHARSQLRL